MICQILRLYLPICRMAMSTKTAPRTIIGMYVEEIFLVMSDELWYSEYRKKSEKSGLISSGVLK